MTAASMLAKLKKLRAARPAPLTDDELCVKFELLVALRDAQKSGDDLTARKLIDSWQKAHPGWWRSKESRAFHNLPRADQAAATAARNAELDQMIAQVQLGEFA